MKWYLVITLFLSIGIGSVSSQEYCPTKTLTEFLQNDVSTVCKPAICEGCYVCMAIKDGTVLIQIRVKHPIAQMKMLMQGYTMFMDPSGKQNERYAIIFPSALDVQDIMKDLRPEQIDPRNPNASDSLKQVRKAPPQKLENPSEEQLKDMAHERPDLRPLLGALTLQGVIIDNSGRQYKLSSDYFDIGLDEGKQEIIYSIIFANSFFIEKHNKGDNFCIGFYSEDKGTGEAPGGEEMGRSDRMPPENNNNMPPSRPDHPLYDTQNTGQDISIEGWVCFDKRQITITSK